MPWSHQMTHPTHRPETALAVRQHWLNNHRALMDINGLINPLSSACPCMFGNVSQSCVAVDPKAIVDDVAKLLTK